MGDCSSLDPIAELCWCVRSIVPCCCRAPVQICEHLQNCPMLDISAQPKVVLECSQTHPNRDSGPRPGDRVQKRRHWSWRPTSILDRGNADQRIKGPLSSFMPSRVRSERRVCSSFNQKYRARVPGRGVGDARENAGWRTRHPLWMTS